MYDFKPIQLPEETASLVEFLLEDTWPFHAGNYDRPDKSKLYQSYSQMSSDKEYFWIIQDTLDKVGMIKLFDLDDIGDGYPMFDLRII